MIWRWRTATGDAIYHVICPDCGLPHGWRTGTDARLVMGHLDGTPEPYWPGNDRTCRCTFWADLQTNDSEPNPLEILD